MPVIQDVNIPGYGTSRDGYSVNANKRYSGRLILNDAQIKALGTKILVASPGPGKMIIFRSGLLIARFTAGYTNISAVTATGNYEVAAAIVGVAFAAAADFGTFFSTAGTKQLPVAAAGGLLDALTVDDSALEFVLANADGALTGGNVANRLEVHFEYSIARV